MTTHRNGYPSTSSPEQERFSEGGIVQFQDGETAFLFDKPDMVVELGPDSKHKYIQHLHSRSAKDLAILKTRSGNYYGLGAGVILNFRNDTAALMPADLPPVVIGKPWRLPDGGNTSEVEAIIFRYKPEDPGNPLHQQMDLPNPFKPLVESLEAGRQMLDSLRVALPQEAESGPMSPLLLPEDIKQPLEASELDDTSLDLKLAGVQLDERWIPAIEALAFYRRRMINSMTAHPGFTAEDLTRRLEGIPNQIQQEPDGLSRLVRDVAYARSTQQEGSWQELTGKAK